MMFTRILPAGLIGVLALASTAAAAPDGWHTSIKNGLDAAKKSNKPLLVVTAWKEKV